MCFLSSSSILGGRRIRARWKGPRRIARQSLCQINRNWRTIAGCQFGRLLDEYGKVNCSQASVMQRFVLRASRRQLVDDDEQQAIRTAMLGASLFTTRMKPSAFRARNRIRLRHDDLSAE